MKCTIYRARKRAYTYLFLREDLTFQDLPAEIVERFDANQPVMELDLTEDRPLAQADAATVRTRLEDPGYHVQLPPEDDPSGWLDLPPKNR